MVLQTPVFVTKGSQYVWILFNIDIINLCLIIIFWLYEIEIASDLSKDMHVLSEKNNFLICWGVDSITTPSM